MQNITLIGMPGAGKSTIGVLLAKRLGYAFQDTDITIQVKTGKTLSQLMIEIGQEALMQLESDVIAELQVNRQVIATGGSAVFGRRGMEHLQQISHIVYLQTGVEEIRHRVGDLVERGVVLNGCRNLDELYAQRAPLYEKYADTVICCDGKTVEECVAAVYVAIKGE